MLLSLGKNKRSFPKTYVIHYTPLKDRKKTLGDTLFSLDIAPEWIEVYDREVVTPEMKKKYYDNSREGWEGRMKIAKSLNRGDFRELSEPEISLCFKHREVLRRVAEGSSDYALILEDDAIFKTKKNKIIKQQIDTLLKKLPLDWDIIFIGGGLSYKTVPFGEQKGNFWKAGTPAVNCTSSFLITQKMAQKMIRENQFSLPFDHELSYLMKKYNAVVYHQIPYIMGQGSVSGNFNSELR